MISIDHTLVSDLLLEKKFVCDLAACKGICCVAGDSGAPILESEKEQIDNALPVVKPYMTGEGLVAIELYGKYVIDSDGDLGTTLVDGKHCAYAFFEDGIAKCAFEKAYNNQETSFKKPISCHLYPVRISTYKTFEAVNFHEWDVCRPACECGNKLKVPVFKFLKEPLIRKYGENWYNQLQYVYENHPDYTGD